jgi:hypothetical protein
MVHVRRTGVRRSLDQEVAEDSGMDNQSATTKLRSRKLWKIGEKQNLQLTRLPSLKITCLLFNLPSSPYEPKKHTEDSEEQMLLSAAERVGITRAATASIYKHQANSCGCATGDYLSTNTQYYSTQTPTDGNTLIHTHKIGVGLARKESRTEG